MSTVVNETRSQVLAQGPRLATVKVKEIFYSLQGESNNVGLPTVFVRLTGCPLRCHYCDTQYAFSGGQVRPLTDILSEVSRYQTRYITVTGGEPLAQPECHTLLHALCDEGYEVALETSGAYDVSKVDLRVTRVMDLKTPASGELARNRYGNLGHMRRHDQVKFVICDRADYDWACAKLNEYSLSDHCEVLFSPAFQQLDPVQLADWVLRDRLPVRMQIQLHKLLWGETPGH